MKRKHAKLNELPYQDRVKFFATGRATVGKITQVVERELINSFVGKVRGIIVQDETGNYKWQTENEAMQCAREFLERTKKIHLAIQQAA